MSALLTIACTTSRTAVDQLMQDYIGDVPGASVVVIQNGRAVLRKSYGMANLEERIASTPRTNYRLASVTKQFTAGAILLLADRRQLSLSDPIRRYLPTLPQYADTITIHHLLTHTSGLLDYEDLIPDGTTEQLLDRDVLRLLEPQDHTYFVPGADYRYSNSGYAFLALIVEAVSGKSFASFLRDEIFQPLKMTGTVAFERGVSEVADRAYGYSRRDGAWVRTDQSRTSAVLGDGGIYSSLEDLIRWDQAIARGELLNADTWRAAFKRHIATGDGNVSYGYGWRISDHRGRPTVSHTGETIGFRNALLRFPEDQLTVIVLTNRNEGVPKEIALRIADLFLD